MEKTVAQRLFWVNELRSEARLMDKTSWAYAAKIKRAKEMEEGAKDLGLHWELDKRIVEVEVNRIGM